MAENQKLPASTLFSSSDGLKTIYSNMSVVRRDKSQIVIYEGDEVNQFYFLKSGYVKVYNINDDGEERILMIRGPGDIFPLLKDPAKPSYTSPYFYDTMTVAEIGTIKQNELLEAASTSREASWELLRYVSEFSSKLTMRLEQIEKKTAEGKLEHLLPYLMDVCGTKLLNGDYRLEIKLTHQDLANLLGIARETVSREIQTLSKKGVIINNNGHIVIPKTAAAKLAD